MIPAPTSTLESGSCCWYLPGNVHLWWYDHTRSWGLSVQASHACGDGGHSSINISLGDVAPAALLLLAHNHHQQMEGRRAAA